MVLIRTFLIFMLLFVSMAYASVHVYGFGSEYRTVDYEENLTVYSLRNKIANKNLSSAVRQNTEFYETYEALVFRNRTMFEIKYSPNKEKNSFILQDGDIILFQSTAIVMNYTQARAFLENRIVNVYPIHQSILARHINVLSARSISKRENKLFPVSEHKLFCEHIAARIQTDICPVPQVNDVDKNSDSFSSTFFNPASIFSLEKHEVEYITPLCVRLTHKDTHMVSCMYFNHVWVNGAPSPTLLSLAIPAWKVTFTQVRDSIKEKSKRLGSEFIPKGEIWLPGLDYIVMRLYMKENSNATFFAADDTSIYILEMSDSTNCLFRLTEDAIYRIPISYLDSH